MEYGQSADYEIARHETAYEEIKTLERARRARLSLDQQALENLVDTLMHGCAETTETITRSYHVSRFAERLAVALGFSKDDSDALSFAGRLHRIEPDILCFIPPLARAGVLLHALDAFRNGASVCNASIAQGARIIRLSIAFEAMINQPDASSIAASEALALLAIDPTHDKTLVFALARLLSPSASQWPTGAREAETPAA
jgi:HD-GYP domain-containing protein (c-di-GMP phosphodiesterase class II)